METPKGPDEGEQLDDARVSQRLQKDACSIATKIFGTNTSTAHAKQHAQLAIDPRLETFDFVFAIGLRKYVERQPLE